jgi:hypothetical protein
MVDYIAIRVLTTDPACWCRNCDLHAGMHECLLLNVTRPRFDSYLTLLELVVPSLKLIHNISSVRDFGPKTHGCKSKHRPSRPRVFPPIFISNTGKQDNHSIEQQSIYKLLNTELERRSPSKVMAKLRLISRRFWVSRDQKSVRDLLYSSTSHTRSPIAALTIAIASPSAQLSSILAACSGRLKMMVVTQYEEGEGESTST